MRRVALAMPVVYTYSYSLYTDTHHTPKMALSLKSAEAERLARALAEATGESLTETITRALEERLQRVQASRDFFAYAEPIQRLQKRIRERPVLDARSNDDIIGYGDDGAPR